MSTNELSRYVGKRADYHLFGHKENRTVTVEILDARKVFGRAELLIKPCMGGGQWWVKMDSLHIEGGSNDKA